MSHLDLPPGLTVRPFEYDQDGIAGSDLDLLTGLVLQLETDYLGRTESSRQEIAEEVEGPGVVRAHTGLVLDAGVAVAAWWIEYDEPGRQVFLEVYVPPGRDDLRATIVEHVLATGRELVAGREGWVLRAGTLAEETDYARLLCSYDYQLVRRFWRMQVRSDAAAVPASQPPLPAGVTVTQTGSRADREAAWRTAEEAFADHWNHVPRPYEQFWERIEVSAGTGPQNHWLLRVDGEPAAVCLLNDSRLEFGEAYVRVLGVRPAYRGRGLAKLLLRRAFVAARDAGRVGTSLHVDAANPTGATRLYESVGMRAVQVIDSYQLAV